MTFQRPLAFCSPHQPARPVWDRRFGPAAYRFIDFLAGSGCKLWQVLPLGPTGYGDLPYQCFSAFAGNPYLVSPELLKNDGLLTAEDFASMPAWPENRVDFGLIYQWKPALLDTAYRRFESIPDTPLREEFEAFCAQHASWLEDFALFMALKDAHGGAAWNEWPAPLRRRDPQALAECAPAARGCHPPPAVPAVPVLPPVARPAELRSQQGYPHHRRYSHLRSDGFRRCGPTPNCSTWTKTGSLPWRVSRPTISPTGQLWGNPLYRWEVHQQTGYRWWVERIRAILSLVDIVRIDHFRGFAGYWEIRAARRPPNTGAGRSAEGIDLFRAIREARATCSSSPKIWGKSRRMSSNCAIRSACRRRKSTSSASPARRTPSCRTTTRATAWCIPARTTTIPPGADCAPRRSRKSNSARRYLNISGNDFAWDLICSAWASVAIFALAPLQDFRTWAAKRA